MTSIPNLNVMTIGVNDTCSIDSNHELFNYGIYIPLNKILYNLENVNMYTVYIEQLKKTLCIYRNDDKEHLVNSLTSIMDFCKENNLNYVAFNDHELKMFNFDEIFDKYDNIKVDIVINK